MRQLLGGEVAFGLRQGGQQVGHRRAWFGRVGRADELLQIGRVDPLADFGQVRCLLGLQVGTGGGGVAGDAVELFYEESAFEGGIQLRGLDARQAAVGEQDGASAPDGPAQEAEASTSGAGVGRGLHADS